MVNHLNGIFAFAVWDINKNEIFLARDHFGVKPLFYSRINETLIFSSEIKALFQYPGVEKIIECIKPYILSFEVKTKEHVYKVTNKENKHTNYEILLICKMKEV